MTDILEKAVSEYLKRRHKKSRPAGNVDWPKDRKMHFTPDRDEVRLCCSGIPDTQLYQHCLTLGHIANLYGVNQQELYKAVRKSNGHR